MGEESTLRTLRARDTSVRDVRTLGDAYVAPDQYANWWVMAVLGVVQKCAYEALFCLKNCT